MYDTLGSGEGLGVAILFLPSVTKFTCAGGLVNNEVKGDLLCLILKPLTSSVTHEFHCLKGANRGEQAETHYWNDNGTIVTAELLVSFNGGAFEKSKLTDIIDDNHTARWLVDERVADGSPPR